MGGLASPLRLAGHGRTKSLSQLAAGLRQAGAPVTAVQPSYRIGNRSVVLGDLAAAGGAGGGFELTLDETLNSGVASGPRPSFAAPWTSLPACMGDGSAAGLVGLGAMPLAPGLQVAREIGAARSSTSLPANLTNFRAIALETWIIPRNHDSSFWVASYGSEPGCDAVTEREPALRLQSRVTLSADGSSFVDATLAQPRADGVLDREALTATSLAWMLSHPELESSVVGEWLSSAAVGHPADARDAVSLAFTLPCFTAITGTRAVVLAGGAEARFATDCHPDLVVLHSWAVVLAAMGVTLGIPALLLLGSGVAAGACSTGGSVRSARRWRAGEALRFVQTSITTSAVTGSARLARNASLVACTIALARVGGAFLTLLVMLLAVILAVSLAAAVVVAAGPSSRMRRLAVLDAQPRIIDGSRLSHSTAIATSSKLADSGSHAEGGLTARTITTGAAVMLADAPAAAAMGTSSQVAAPLPPAKRAFWGNWVVECAPSAVLVQAASLAAPRRSQAMRAAIQEAMADGFEAAWARVRVAAVVLRPVQLVLDFACLIFAGLCLAELKFMIPQGPISRSLVANALSAAGLPITESTIAATIVGVQAWSISASQRSDLFRQGSHSASFSASRATARTPAMSMTSRAIRITERALAAAAKDTAHVAGLSSVAQASATLPDLDYGYDALEPVISAGIMELHHSKHHQTYVNNLNAALEKYTDAEARGDVAAMIALQGAIRFNGGGHINHSLFWKNLAPASAGGGGAPEGELAKRIDAEFGDFESFKAKFNAQTAAVQGSGWGWLVYHPEKDTVAIHTTQNQDPVSMSGLVPLLGVDVWEHAYYLDYKNARPEYLKNIWKVVDMGEVAARLDQARA
ncbi:hypothetical protein FNF28_00322 [Cafeteria roenbergensis]|uniref:Superoxide dismutase [Fe] n=1 Tax=Cafeteria roenbergensis TaxID=33653 RepID=A0A5A8E2H2_CAFRO|nr:hypothetical protein FNF28_00322 [Cafeteria roenbergensis]